MRDAYRDWYQARRVMITGGLGLFNVGGSEPISHRDLVQLLIDVAGGGSVRFVDWPVEKKIIDIGSFYSNSTKFAETTGWQAGSSLREALRETVEFYRAHLPHYLQDPS